LQASQDRKVDDIKEQIKDQLDCVINEMKSEMENRIKSLQEKVKKWSGRNCPELTALEVLQTLDESRKAEHQSIGIDIQAQAIQEPNQSGIVDWKPDWRPYERS